MARDGLDITIKRFEASEDFRDLSLRLRGITAGMLWNGFRVLEGLGIANKLDDNCWFMTEEGWDIMEEVSIPWGFQKTQSNLQ